MLADGTSFWMRDASHGVAFDDDGVDQSEDGGIFQDDAHGPHG